MRHLYASIVAAFAVTVTSSWSVAQELCLSTADLQTQLSFCGQEPFRETDGTVSDSRLITVADSPVLLVLWNETSATDLDVPFYAISLDGSKIDVVRRTSYDLKLKYARFDPLLVDPVAEPALTADSANELYLVQFVTQPLPAFRSVLGKLGATVHGFVPNNAFVVRMGSAVVAQVESLPFVRSVRTYHPAYRIESYLRENFDQLDELFPEQRYNVMVNERGPDQKNTLAEHIRAIGGTVDSLPNLGFLLQATLTPAQLLSVAHRNEVAFIDRWMEAVPAMDHARKVTGADYVETVRVPGYTGQGVRGEVMDLGVFTGHCDFLAHPPMLHGDLPVASMEHGTRVYGEVFGDGTCRANARGMLPDAEPIMANAPWGTGILLREQHTAELVDPLGPYQAVFQSNSWFSGHSMAYETEAFELDDILIQHDLVILQAQGNQGDQNSGRQAWAKNVVSVGGVFHDDNDTPFDDLWAPAPESGLTKASSHGPAADGRVKPDLVHFYDNILTTSVLPRSLWPPEGPPYDLYIEEMGGTSGATPIVAGMFGLFFQMWADGVFPVTLPDPNCDPQVENCVFKNRAHAATAKAMMINTARPYCFTDEIDCFPYSFNENLTRDKQGWGMPDVGKMYALARSNSFPYIVDETEILTLSLGAGIELEVPADAAALKVTLVFTDPAGDPAALEARVNDLSLQVRRVGGECYLGNHGLIDSNWSPPATDCSIGTSLEVNTIDTVENVFVKNPSPGTWAVTVYAMYIDVEGDGHPETPELDVDYGLVVSLDFDCNDNGFLDSEDVADGRSADCNNNGVPDECDISSGTSADCHNGNGVPDECEAYPVDPPTTDSVQRNRYIAFTPTNPGMQTALRVTLTNMPSPFEDHEGCHLWVTQPSVVPDASGDPAPIPPPPVPGQSFWAAGLEFTTTPHYMDWGNLGFGMVYVSDDEIVPEATYQIQAIRQDCDDITAEAAYSAPLTIYTGVWGDVAGDFDAINNVWLPPDGDADFDDVSAVLDRFYNQPYAPPKAQADVSPDVPDRNVDFGDIPNVLDAFRGLPYPFDGPEECP